MIKRWRWLLLKHSFENIIKWDNHVQPSGFKLGPVSKEKSPVKQSDSAKLRHFLSVYKQISTHTIAIKWKEKYNDCHYSLRLCGDRMKTSLPKKRFFFRETPTYPWVPFGAKFRPSISPLTMQSGQSVCAQAHTIKNYQRILIF